MPTWSNFNFQNGASPLMEQIIFFHDHTSIILIMITILVGYLMFILFFNKFINRFLLEGQMIELMWTEIKQVNSVWSKIINPMDKGWFMKIIMMESIMISKDKNIFKISKNSLKKNNNFGDYW